MKNKRGDWHVQMHKEMKRGLLNMWILWTLKKKGGKMYGYEIMKSLKLMSRGKWTPKAGTIYPVLRRLEERGFVKSEWVKAGGPNRRYYKITAEGRKAANTAISEWGKMMAGFRDFLHELFGVD